MVRQKFLFPRQTASYRITDRKSNENITERQGISAINAIIKILSKQNGRNPSKESLKTESRNCFINMNSGAYTPGVPQGRETESIAGDVVLKLTREDTEYVTEVLNSLLSTFDRHLQ